MHSGTFWKLILWRLLCKCLFYLCLLFFTLYINILFYRIIKSNYEFLLLRLIHFLKFFNYYYFFTLQYCIGFAIHQHASTTGVHVFPILNPPPTSLYHLSGSSQCTSPKLPVSCIEPGLAISIIHVLMPFSQIFPPSPSPTESKRLFYTSVSLLLSCIQGYRFVANNR